MVQAPGAPQTSWARETSGSSPTGVGDHHRPLGPKCSEQPTGPLGEAFRPASLSLGFGASRTSPPGRLVGLPTVRAGAPSRPYGFPRGSPSGSRSSAPAPRSNADSTDEVGGVKVTKPQVATRSRTSDGVTNPTDKIGHRAFALVSGLGVPPPFPRDDPANPSWRVRTPRG